MSRFLNRSLFGVFAAAVALSAGTAMGGDAVTLEGMTNEQARQMTQTKSQNKVSEKLQKQWNGGAEGADAMQQQNRVRKMEQKRQRTHSQMPGGPGTEVGTTSRRMAGSGPGARGGAGGGRK